MARQLRDFLKDGEAESAPLPVATALGCGANGLVSVRVRGLRRSDKPMLHAFVEFTAA